jgi:predicted ArsR family transcriptional regulator
VVERKESILVFLKSHGEASLADVAEHLGMSKQGALRHLEALVEGGLVERSTVSPAGPGRPEHHFRVTPAAGGAFPTGERELAVELVDFMEQDQLERFFAARTARVEREYAQKLAGLDLDARVRELARLAREAGHMTEVVELAGGRLALRHCNCPLPDVVSRAASPCRHEQAMYERLLGTGVERSTWMAAQDATCTYEINTQS